jgi:hypothetical protein
MTPDKSTVRSRAALRDRRAVRGYEIHLGATEGPDCARPVLTIGDRPDGARDQRDGRVRGTYVHGLFTSDEFRRAWLAEFRSRRSSPTRSGSSSALDALADHLEAHLDVERIVAIARGRRARARAPRRAPAADAVTPGGSRASTTCPTSATRTRPVRAPGTWVFFAVSACRSISNQQPNGDGRHRTRVAPAAAQTLPADKPARIVSLNMCTDDLLLRLADPARIASVTWLSRAQRGSNVADIAARLPVNHGLAEEIIPLDPDLVIAGTFSTRTAVATAQAYQDPARRVRHPRSIEEIRGTFAPWRGWSARSEQASGSSGRWTNASPRCRPGLARARAPSCSIRTARTSVAARWSTRS